MAHKPLISRRSDPAVPNGVINQNYQTVLRRVAFFITAFTFSLLQVAPLTVHAQELARQARTIDHVAPQALQPNRPPEGWTHVAIISQPKLTHGNVAEVPQVAGKYAEKFGTILVANVTRHQVNGQPIHQLNRVGIGHTMRNNKQLLIVNSKSPELGFLDAQVLSSGETALAELRLVAQYETAILFDAPAILLRNNDHHELVIRHLIWTSRKNGGLATAMWVMQPTTQKTYQIVDKHFVWMPEKFREQRRLSVDSNQFTFGIPGKKAFAMVDLPAGKKVAFTQSLAKVASLTQYNNASLTQLAAELGKAMHGK